MTRVNLIDPVYLYDQHLMAEIREMPMIPASMQRSENSKNGIRWNKIPKEYKLNRGHVMFFYLHGDFLKKRWKRLIAEAKSRGWNVDENRMWFDPWYRNNTMNDFIIKDRNIQENTERIIERYEAKPGWYRYSGKINIPPIQIYKQSITNKQIRTLL